MHYSFHDPQFLWLLLLLPLVALLRGRKGANSAIIFSSTALTAGIHDFKRSRAGRFMFGMRLVALGFFIIALARPQYSKGESQVEASGIDIVLAIDISSSMLGLDFSTENELRTRLQVAKGVVEDFIERRPSDRIGLVAFAGDPYLLSPLTLNHDWLKENLKRLEVGVVPDGTAIGTAIAMSVNRIKDLKSKSRIIILLTDGVNNSGKIGPVAAAEAASSFKTKIYTVAVGQGGFVPTLYLNQQGQLAKNVFGQYDVAQVEMPVDVETLDKIAQATGGKSYSASNLKELKNIYGEIDRLEKTEVKLKYYAQYSELFMVPVILGFVLLGLEQLLVNTRFRRLP